MNADNRDTADSPVIEEDRSNWLRLVKNRKQRERYGVAHKRRRAEFAKRLERGEVITCMRCGLEIGPDQNWELDHSDRDPSWSWPSHQWCNRGAPHRNVTSCEW